MQELNIVKIGGNIIENKQELSNFLALFSAMDEPKILVHGGGKKASDISSKLGIEPKLVGGRRITDAESLEVALMVYAGLINKNIVAALQALSCNAIGLSGADGNAILAHKRPVKDIDYGYAGDVDAVKSATLEVLVRAGLCPVLCALTHDGRGQMLNTNADTIAAETAIAMSTTYTVNLYYCFEKKGVLSDVADENSVIAQIDSSSYAAFLDQGIIAEGMLPKLENCFHALKHGVSKVYIGNTQMMKPGESQFTTITL